MTVLNIEIFNACRLICIDIDRRRYVMAKSTSLNGQLRVSWNFYNVILVSSAFPFRVHMKSKNGLVETKAVYSNASFILDVCNRSSVSMFLPHPQSCLRLAFGFPGTISDYLLYRPYSSLDVAVQIVFRFRFARFLPFDPSCPYGINYWLLSPFLLEIPRRLVSNISTCELVDML